MLEQKKRVLGDSDKTANAEICHLVTVGCSTGAGKQQRENRTLQLFTYLPQKVPEGAT